MALKSAYDDLRERTLARIEGIWGRLAYVANRRSPDGSYEHWGFERNHGLAAAQDSFARAHQSLVGNVLRTRLRALREDLERSSAAEGASPASYASKLTGGLYRLLPVGSARMTEQHLISVLKALSALEGRQPRGSRSASQRPQPDQSLRPPGDVEAP